MDIQKLNKLLKRQEGPKLDFKETLHLETESEKKEFTKDIIAIANSRGGRGYIIYGIQDKTKKIIGVDHEAFVEEKLQQIAYNRIDPPVPLATDCIEINGKSVVVLTIYADNHKPYQMMRNGAFYIRRGSTTDIARRSELANAFQECGMMTYETVILKNARVEDLDTHTIQKYLSNMGITAEYPSNMLLESMGIIGERIGTQEYNVTIGGMLLFGKNPSVFLPHAFVKVDSAEEAVCFCGNILKLLNDVSEYLRKFIKYEAYPFAALEEAVANAIIHRDYLDNSRGININITSKSIEISNPGALIAGNTVYKFIKESNPERRNPWLYQRILVLDEKARFSKSGVGMKRIRQAFSDIGYVKFVNLGSHNLFKVILPLK